jgi:GDPmannose 4,6-dehydratase
MSRALIVGSEGQDGRLLTERLAQEGISVVGIGRDSVRGELAGRVERVAIDSRADVRRILDMWKPDEVYYLAAAHRSSQDRSPGGDGTELDESVRVNFLGIAHVIDAMRESVPDASLFYAASSLVFGKALDSPQNETTPLDPDSLYGITKAAGVGYCRLSRRSGMKVSVGFLYNHESPLRRSTFVSARIVQGAVSIAAGSAEKLVLGDLSARVDWGYAPDFVDAMRRIVRLPVADDYVIATGEAHSVREFVEIAFSCLGLDWREHVVEDRSVLTRQSTQLVGDSSRLRERTGWQPTVSFSEMVSILVTFARNQHVT